MYADIVVGGFIVAGFTAAYGYPWQAFFYFMAVVHAPVVDEVQFTFVSVLYIVMLLFASAYRSSSSGR